MLLSKKIFAMHGNHASWVYILFSRCKIIYIAAILNVFVLVGAQGDVWPDAVCSDISALLINADEKSTQAEMDTYERDNLDTYRQSTDKIEYNVYMLPSWLSRKYFGRKSIFFPAKRCADGCIGKAVENQGNNKIIVEFYYVSHAVVEPYLDGPYPPPKDRSTATLFLGSDKASFVYFVGGDENHLNAANMFVKTQDQLEESKRGPYRDCLANIDGNRRMTSSSNPPTDSSGK